MRLADRVSPIQNWPGASLMSSAGFLRTIKVDVSKKALLEVKIIERIDNRVGVGACHRKAQILIRHIGFQCAAGEYRMKSGAAHRDYDII